MAKSAVGTTEAPGRNVRAKSVLDQGGFEFRRQWEYKQAWRGGDVLAVPPHHTSQTCPSCSHVSAENRRTQARFVCVACGYENNADTVGAINILERTSLVSLRREGAVRPLDETGTHRSDSGASRLGAVGISSLSAGAATVMSREGACQPEK